MAALGRAHLVCAILLVQVVPCPHLRSGQQRCSIWRSNVAKKIIQARWLPVVARYNVSLPLTCPLHPARHWPATPRRRAATSGWRCALCGRQFSRDVLLDHHYRTHHSADLTQQDETLVCLAELCGILRCSVYSHVLTSDRSDLETTDIQPAGAAASSQHAVEPSRPRHLQKYSETAVFNDAARWQCSGCVESVRDGLGQCVEKPTKSNASVVDLSGWWWWSHTWWWLDDVTSTSQTDEPSGCEEGQSEREFTEQVCDASKMERLRVMCEELIADCLLPIILYLSPEEFRAMHEELLHATCWYLACGRYWERSAAPVRSLPWGRIAAVLTLLTLLLTYVYYLICVTRMDRRRGPESGRNSSSDFIQVDCPNELKRRLLERTVSREPARPARPNDLFAIYDGDYDLAPANHVDY